MPHNARDDLQAMDYSKTQGLQRKPSAFFPVRSIRLLGRLLCGSEQVPLTGDTLQDVSAAIDEADARAGDEVFDGAGY